MAGTSDKELFRLGGFPAGLNNRASSTEGPTDENGVQVALREAVNVSLTAQGHPKRRPGQVARAAGKAHSLFAMEPWLLAVVDGELRAYMPAADGALTPDAVLATPGDRFCTFAGDDFSVWWSNGVTGGRIDEDMTAHPFWIDTPDPVRLAVGSGALAAGRYEVSVTALDAAGRESGASGAVGIDVPTGGSLAVTLPAAPLGAVRWRLYVTPPDGEVLYQQAELPAGATSANVGNLTPSAKLETQWLHPLVPVQCLRYGHSRLFGLAGNVLIWSEPYRLGLMAPDNHVVLGSEATLLEPVGDGAEGAGVWVADHKRTYFMAGADPESWQQQARYPHAAVPGTSCTVPGSYFGLETTGNVAFWMARNGTPCIGLPGGQLIALREDALALPVDGERGATGLMLFEGIHQLLTTTFGSSANLAAASDSAEATVKRRDYRPT
ncbi:MAG TPA: hypothetical protein VGE09_03430 [Pseudoxanthomonas sp.]